MMTPEKKRPKQIIVFTIANEELALDIGCVREVLRPQEVYSLPDGPEWIEGLINLRGHIIALIDLRKRLHKKSIGDYRKRIIICKVNRFVFGVTVDHLREIIALPEENIEPVPKVAALQMNLDLVASLAKIGERIIPVLDLEHLITKKEVDELLELR